MQVEASSGYRARMATKKKASPAAQKPSRPKALARDVERIDDDPRAFPFEIDPKKLEASLKKLGDQVVKMAKKGRYTKVRFKFRGKQVLPDIPLAAVAAVEGLSFYWAGLLRLLVFNLAGRTVIDIEYVNDSEKKLQAGKEALLSGDLSEALAAFHQAQEMDHDNPLVHLNLGIAYKLQGDHPLARASLLTAKSLDEKNGVTANEADRLLATLKPAPASM
jgi:tetratricopeptide (TPR) repeat protein